MVNGYKVTDVNRKRTVGLTCSTLEQLIQKGCKKLQISKVAEVHLQDGTVVNDENYFQTIPSQTVFVFRKPGEKVLTERIPIFSQNLVSFE